MTTKEANECRARLSQLQGPVEPGSFEWLNRVAVVHAEEAEQPLRWFYMSFVDEDRGGFLGACVVEARGMLDATMQTHASGINPGGEVLTIEVEEGAIENFPEPMRNRLLSRADLETLGPVMKLSEIEERKRAANVKLEAQSA